MQLLTGIVHVFDAKTNRTLTMGPGLVSLSIFATITAEHRLNEPCFYCYSIVFLHNFLLLQSICARNLCTRSTKEHRSSVFEIPFLGHQTLRKSNTCTHTVQTMAISKSNTKIEQSKEKQLEMEKKLLQSTAMNRI